MTSKMSKIRLKSPADVITTIPYLVGFQPTESLVVLGLNDMKVTLTMRMDLPQDAGHANEVLYYIDQSKVTEVGLVAYTEDDDDRHELLTAIAQGLQNRGVKLMDAFRVTGGRWYTYFCSNPACCPPDGTPIETASAVAAQAVSEGLVARASRSELEASLAAASDAARDEIRSQIEGIVPPDPKSMGDLIVVVSMGSPDPESFIDWVAANLTPRRTAELLVALKDWRFRDPLLLHWEHDALRDLLIELTRFAPDGYVAPAAGSLAAVAYMQGDGALANIALDRCLADDEDYSLGNLVATAIKNGLDPKVMRAAWRRAADDMQQA